ncbi:unnamed protein product [Symbiodinium necroappetens]|uniref:Uncharacterized protein n=1 Tax=Symbiodinium necroappetens TaxID=1628268 RepID=A0A812LMP5_9DINO|nr:unnamed protein product [Symbiodinium necroappetens]
MIDPSDVGRSGFLRKTLADVKVPPDAVNLRLGVRIQRLELLRCSYDFGRSIGNQYWVIPCTVLVKAVHHVPWVDSMRFSQQFECGMTLRATVIDDMHKLGEFRQQVVKNVFVQPGAETCELKVRADLHQWRPGAARISHAEAPTASFIALLPSAGKVHQLYSLLLRLPA